MVHQVTTEIHAALVLTTAAGPHHWRQGGWLKPLTAVPSAAKALSLPSSCSSWRPLHHLPPRPITERIAARVWRPVDCCRPPLILCQRPIGDRSPTREGSWSSTAPKLGIHVQGSLWHGLEFIRDLGSRHVASRGHSRTTIPCLLPHSYGSSEADDPHRDALPFSANVADPSLEAGVPMVMPPSSIGCESSHRYRRRRTRVCLDHRRGHSYRQ